MTFLRILAFFYMFFWVMNIARSLLGNGPQRRGPQFGGARRPPPPPPFNAYGPFGPFGPFSQQGGQQAPPRRDPPPRPKPQVKSAYEILGVRPGASSADIRRAYQTMVRQYHPDRTADLAPELRDLAEQRTKEITNAYNQLKRNG